MNINGYNITEIGRFTNVSPMDTAFQSGIGAGAGTGITVGFVFGTPSDLAGPFENVHIDFGLFSIDVYINGNGDVVGGGLGYGGGFGADVTETNTALYQYYKNSNNNCDYK